MNSDSAIPPDSVAVPESVDVVSGAAPMFDMTPFRLSRFFDGAPIKAGGVV